MYDGINGSNFHSCDMIVAIVLWEHEKASFRKVRVN